MSQSIDYLGAPVWPCRVRLELRVRIEALIEALIGYLDKFDGDADFEANGDLEPDVDGEAGADMEPSLGWSEGQGAPPDAWLTDGGLTPDCEAS